MDSQENNESVKNPDAPEIKVKNPRIGKVQKLEEEVRRRNELEQLRAKRIRKEQEYIEQMSKAVEDHLRNTREEQRYNEEFERLIRKDVYQMHGISEDKLQGMTEYRNAWYQGTAFGMFFLSLILTGICGYLHGFGSELCIFMAFYTAIEGTLLTNGKREHALLNIVTKILYLLLFPAMLIVFVCYELGFTEYGIVVPVLTVAGVVILMLGAVSYFLYDPYRLDRKNHKKANRYIRDIEKAAVKEVELEEKALAKLAKKQEKLEQKEEARQEKAAKRRDRQNRREEKQVAWKKALREKLPFGKKEEVVPAAETNAQTAEAQTTEETDAKVDGQTTDTQVNTEVVAQAAEPAAGSADIAATGNASTAEPAEHPVLESGNETPETTETTEEV